MVLLLNMRHQGYLPVCLPICITVKARKTHSTSLFPTWNSWRFLFLSDSVKKGLSTKNTSDSIMPMGETNWHDSREQTYQNQWLEFSPKAQGRNQIPLLKSLLLFGKSPWSIDSIDIHSQSPQIYWSVAEVDPPIFIELPINSMIHPMRPH